MDIGWAFLKLIGFAAVVIWIGVAWAVGRCWGRADGRRNTAGLWGAVVICVLLALFSSERDLPEFDRDGELDEEAAELNAQYWARTTPQERQADRLRAFLSTLGMSLVPALAGYAVGRGENPRDLPETGATPEHAVSQGARLRPDEAPTEAVGNGFSRESLREAGAWRMGVALTAGLLVIAVLRLPSWYYTHLRLVVGVTSFWGVYIAVRGKRQVWACLMGTVLLLFNPVCPFRMPKAMWVIVDLVAVGVMVASIKPLFTYTYLVVANRPPSPRGNPDDWGR